MNNKLILFLGLLITSLISSCINDENNKKPEDLIPEPQMIEVLADICKVEARFQRRLSIRGKDNSELVLQNYNVIFNAHNVTLPQFKTSFEYYEDSPKKMQELYDSVIVILTKEEALLKEAEKQKQK
ncbi:DUF4296 domain-containing protein [bacterium SCSIO 12643]|nr:DUF4296 domain-containing protein [bacterium SCSIO 12643]